MTKLDPLRQSWKHSPSLHETPPGATADTIAEFERSAAWELPPEMRALYEWSDGPSLLEGNLNFHPLLEGTPGVLQLSAEMRSHNWPVPPQLWIFADNGGGSYFGLWVQGHGVPHDPIIEIGQIFEPGCMAIAATSLFHLLLGRTAFYSIVCEAPAPALDAIDVPSRFRNLDPDWDEVSAWADPQRPGGPADPYEACLDATQLAAILDGFAA